MTVLLANAPTRIPLEDGKERFFVKAGSRWPFSVEKSPERSCRYVPFPFSLAYVAGMLERESIPVEVFDGVALNVDEDRFVDRCKGYKPGVIVMEATTPTIEQDLALCRRLKRETGARIALCGAHPTTFAEQLVKECDAVDWVFRGEYENIAMETLRAWHSGASAERFAAIPGLVSAESVEGERRVHVGPKAPPIHDLDALPYPARHMFPTRQAPSMWPYWDGFCQRRPAVQMHSSRGCPFKCTFCLWVSVIYEQGPYRTFSPKRIVDEMEHVVATYGAREIYFDDDIFTVREDHVLGFCEELKRRNLGIAWSVMGDAMAVTHKAVDAMADAGCIGMKFGIESVNPAVLKKLRKPIKPNRVKEVAGWCSARGIKTHATITFGLEADTPETMEETLKFCCELPVDSIQFSVTTPFPGTEHHARATSAGKITARSWDEYDGARSSVLAFDGMSTDQVSEFARLAPSRWLRARLRDPAWCKRQLKYFRDIALDQGLSGVLRRSERGLGLLLGARG